jgi:hypothetical protein
MSKFASPTKKIGAGNFRPITVKLGAAGEKPLP